MSGPTKILPFVKPVLSAAVATATTVKQSFSGYPRFALEFARPLPLPILGFGIPGGMRPEKPRR